MTYEQVIESLREQLHLSFLLRGLDPKIIIMSETQYTNVVNGCNVHIGPVRMLEKGKIEVFGVPVAVVSLCDRSINLPGVY